VTSFVLPGRRARLRRGSDLLGRPAVAALLRRGSDAAAIRQVMAALRRTPFATALATTLLASTITLRHVVDDDQELLRWASTNLDNLRARPLRSLAFSAVLPSDERWLPYAGAIAAVVAPLERRLGAGRVTALFVAGHVIPTLLTEGGVALGIAAGVVPAGARDRMDVGVSYGLWAVGGATLVLLPRRWRTACLTGAAASVAVLLAVDPDRMTAIGHALSLAIGVASWPYLRRSMTAGGRPGS
jgi:hypothetical protein